MKKKEPGSYPKNHKTTPMQKRAVDNLMSGQYKTDKAAIMAAGFSKQSAEKGKSMILKTTGAQKYLENFEQKALDRFGMTLESKLQDVYLDGLDADKPWGKNNIIPDFDVRKKYADRIAEMLGVIETKSKKAAQQFNFFMFDKKERGQFNQMFNKFVRDSS
ncbi:hypothetical protein KKF61_06925 [Patescibacteria group bacterium]|nr:hypothetical protein [Patescibacteria group bacterium]